MIRQICGTYNQFVCCSDYERILEESGYSGKALEVEVSKSFGQWFKETVNDCLTLTFAKKYYMHAINN